MKWQPPILRHHSSGARKKQAGLALVAMILFIMVAFGFFGLRQLNSNVRQTVVTGETERMLSRAKEALIAYSTRPDPTNLGPGRLPFPDVVTNTSLTYDGLGETGCVSRTWVSGTALPSTATAANQLALRCVGRLPWRTISLQIDNLPADHDPDGVMPWYAFSPRLMNSTSPGCQYVSPNRIHSTTDCGGIAWPWLTVVDAKGNVLTNRAAVVILIPGPKLFTQNRTIAPVPDSSAYLDRVVVQAGCTAPCVPGTYDNARRRILGFTLAADNAVNLRFIQCADISTVASNDPNYAHPYRCNDKLTYITIDELMAAAGRSALTFAADILRKFYAAKGYYPYAAKLGELDCSVGQEHGLIPSGNPNPPPTGVICQTGSQQFGTQTISDVPSARYDWNWFRDNYWAESIYYHAAPGCLESATPPRCKTNLLTVGSQSNVHAILIETGRPITTIVGQIPPVTTPPYANSKGANQTGWGSGYGSGSTSPSDYLDSVVNATGSTTRIYDGVNASRGSSVYNDQVRIVSQ